MWSGEGRWLPAVAVVIAWRAAGAGPVAPAAPGVRVATTPPIAQVIEPRPGMAVAGKRPWSPLAPIQPFGPWQRRPLPPMAPPAGQLPPRETPGKQEPAPVRTPVTPPPAAGVLRAHLPTAVVLHALDAGQAAFRACWVRSHRQNAAPSSGKIQIHVEVDADGKVSAAHSDTDAAPLDRCLCNVAAHLPFPARGQPASAELSLLFPVGG
ncbi:MAG TPA: hypothetical protein VGC42_28340 [Kofleriaceae bacterium]